MYARRPPAAAQLKRGGDGSEYGVVAFKLVHSLSLSDVVGVAIRDL